MLEFDLPEIQQSYIIQYKPYYSGRFFKKSVLFMAQKNLYWRKSFNFFCIITITVIGGGGGGGGGGGSTSSSSSSSSKPSI